jgi:hypothetical protein
MRFQALLDSLLVGRYCVIETERQGRVAVDAVRRYECHLTLVRDLQGYSGDTLSSSRGRIAGCF